MSAMTIIPLTTAGRDLHALHDGLESTHRALGQRHGAEARDRGASPGEIHGWNPWEPWSLEQHG